MSDIVVSMARSVSCAQHYTIDNPMGDTVYRSPGEIEREHDNAQPRVNAELGALGDMDVKLPSNCPMPGIDIVVSSIPAPTASCELP